MPSLIALTTDFGEREPFVAAVKGELFSRCPGVQVVDLTHAIPRHSVMEGALYIARAIPHFPEGTVHLVGLSPGPQPIALSVLGQKIVCPDNGVTTLLSHRHGIDEAVVINHPDAHLKEGEQTFFARDVFAPIAALLAAGAKLTEVGTPLEDVARLSLPSPHREGKTLLAGEVMHVDRFGNLITNVHRDDVEGASVEHVEVGLFPIGALSQTYSQVPTGKPLALFGSAGYLEIAYNGDRADKRLEMGPGIIVKLTVKA